MLTLLKTVWKTVWITIVTLVVIFIVITFCLFWIKVAWWTWKLPW